MVLCINKNLYRANSRKEAISVENHTHSHEHSHSHEHEHSHSHEHTYTHEHEHSHEHTHSHDHTHTHSHGHNHPNAKAVSNRLARAIGHLEKVKQMVDDGEDCTQVLIQLVAVRSALTNAGKVILKDHIDHCIVDAVENNDLDKIAELNEAISQFVK